VPLWEDEVDDEIDNLEGIQCTTCSRSSDKLAVQGAVHVALGFGYQKANIEKGQRLASR
jgi:hypothetical protein